MNASIFGRKDGLAVHNPTGFKRTAFTVIELLVVLGAIAILGVMLLPALAGTQAQSKVTACAARYRQWAASANLYANDNQGWLPLKPGTYFTVPAGAYAWDVPTNMVNALFPYGMDVPVWFCPMRPAALDNVNAWAKSHLGHPIQNINDLGLYFSYTYSGEIILNDNYWVKRSVGATMYPNSDLYMTLPRKTWPTWLQNEGTPTFLMYGWPQRLHDLAAPYVPFVSDTAGQSQYNTGGGGLIPSPNWNGVVGDPSMISPNTAHFVNGVILGVNLAFADGHVASHTPDQMRCAYADVNTGGTLWFY